VHVVELDAVEVDVHAVEDDGLVGEEGTANGDDLPHGGERAGPVDADLAGQRVPPGADPEQHAAGGQVVEGREAGGQSGRVAAPAVDDAGADLDVVGDRGEGGHRDEAVAHQAAVGLPDRLEAPGLGVADQVHALPDAVRVLEVEGDPVHVGSTA
jgi:hypothetical protein